MNYTERKVEEILDIIELEDSNYQLLLDKINEIIEETRHACAESVASFRNREKYLFNSNQLTDEIHNAVMNTELK